MNRHDWLWLALRGTGIFFLARAVLLGPGAIHAVRMRDLVYGDAADAIPFALGIEGHLITLGLYAVAAAVFFLVPIPHGEGAR